MRLIAVLGKNSAARLNQRQLLGNFKSESPECMILNVRLPDHSGLDQRTTEQQVAADLHITERTVKMYRANTLEKLEVDSMAELARLAVDLGIDPAAPQP